LTAHLGLFSASSFPLMPVWPAVHFTCTLPGCVPGARARFGHVWATF